jgi:hypothetical protein
MCESAARRFEFALVREPFDVLEFAEGSSRRASFVAGLGVEKDDSVSATFSTS